MIFISILFLLFILNHPYVNATVYFYDYFDRTDLFEKWIYKGNVATNYSWNITNNELENRLFDSIPSVIVSGVGETYSDFEITADIHAISGVDQQFIARADESLLNYYQIDFRYLDPNYRTDDGNNIRLFKWVNGDYKLLVDKIPINNEYFLDLGRVHKIKIIFNGQNIKVYFDGFLVINHIDFSPIYTGSVGLKNWAGAYPNVLNYYDNFIIRSIGSNDFPIILTPTFSPSPTQTPTTTPSPTQTPTPTLTPTLAPTVTPTPTVAVKPKVIFVPGLGASWNTRAMAHGEIVGDDEWVMTPFVNNYDSFFESLEKNGLIRNEDYFVWNYDWRKSLPMIVEKFDSYLSRIGINQEDNVVVIGHSLGGLVARVWSQNYSNNMVDKIITVGSPHLGSIDAYGIWNGNRVIGKDNVSVTALTLLATLQNSNGDTVNEIIHKFAPILKDLIPVFDFISINGQSLSANNLVSPNNYLMAQNGLPVPNSLESGVGLGISTPEWIEMSPRLSIDKLLKIWPDGRPVNWQWGNGDGTVLDLSARYGGVSQNVDSDHGNLVKKDIDYLLGKLNLKMVETTPIPELLGKRLYVIASPAKLEPICWNGANTWVNKGDFLVVDPIGCDVKIVGQETGAYHLVSGIVGTNQDSFEYFESDISKGEIQMINYQNERNSKFLKRIVVQNIKSLRKTKGVNNNLLDKALKYTEDENYRRSQDLIIKFRNQSGETRKTKVILSNLTLLQKFDRRHWWEWLVDFTELEGKLKKVPKKISYIEAINRQESDDLLNQAKYWYKSDFGLSLSKLNLAKDLLD